MVKIISYKCLKIVSSLILFNRQIQNLIKELLLVAEIYEDSEI